MPARDCRARRLIVKRGAVIVMESPFSKLRLHMGIAQHICPLVAVLTTPWCATERAVYAETASKEETTEQPDQLIMEVNCAAKAGKVERLRAILDAHPEAVNAPWPTDYWPGRTPLHFAASEGRAEAVRLLLVRGAKVDEREVGYFGLTPLLDAVSARVVPVEHRVQVARLLLDAGANPNLRDHQNRNTPLHVAAEQQSARLVELLLAHGAEVNATGLDGLTPLHWSLHHPKADARVVDLLIEHGANVNAECDGKTVLQTAVLLGSRDMVELLLQRGAKLDALTAVYLGRRATVKEMLQQDASLARKGFGGLLRWTLLDMAAQVGDLDTARILLRQGATTRRHGDGFGRAPLELAIRNKHLEMAELLLEHGADPADAMFDAVHFAGPESVALLVRFGGDIEQELYIHGGSGAQTPLHSVAANAELVKTLLDLGADINAESEVGFTPLYLAAHASIEQEWRFEPKEGREARRRQTRDHVRFMIRKGARLDVFSASMAGLTGELEQLLDRDPAQVSARDSRSKHMHVPAQWTPLHWAVYANRRDTAELLLRRGADVDATDGDGNTPLFFAGTPLAEVLLEHKADVTRKNGEGQTPLHRSGLVELSELFLDHGADVNAADAEGMTPLHQVARWSSKADLAEVLLDHGADLNRKSADGSTALHLAAAGSKTQLVELLLDRGAGLDARDAKGNTPLHRAAGWAPFDNANAQRVVKLLLEHGADPRAQDRQGRTPYELALQRCFASIAEVLR